MAETLDQIKHHIDAQRGRLSVDINELEARVRETVNWRVQFSRHATAILAAAFGLGALLALMMPGGSKE